MSTQTDKLDILGKIDEIDDFPTFPEIVMKLTQLLRNSETSIDEIEKAIKTDAVIAGNVMHLANTVAFNTAGKIVSIGEAVARIGFKNVSDIVLSISVIKSFPNEGLISYSKFWHHCLAVAYGSQIMERYGLKVIQPSETLYMAGLLHDLGILVLDQYFPDLFREVLQRAKQSELSLVEIERLVLNTDHIQVGAKVLEKWELPTDVIETVRFQNMPHRARDKNAKILHLANFACENQGIGNGIESFPEGFSNAAWFELGLKVDDIPEIIDEVNVQLAKAKAIFMIAKKKTPDARYQVEEEKEEDGDKPSYQLF